MKEWARVSLVRIALIASVLLAVYAIVRLLGANSLFEDPTVIERWVGSVGVFGPPALIALIALAIVVSPLPSAPIALAAGAAYGHYWGTLYVVLGAEIGASAAFLIARLVGGQRLQQWFGNRLSVGLIGSQWRLTGVVFGLRLLPFVSFDIVSYAAGLTPLAFWRFALATLLGLVPVSFLLTHFGDELVGGELDRIGLAVLALGVLTASSALLMRIRKPREGPGG